MLSTFKIIQASALFSSDYLLSKNVFEFTTLVYQRCQFVEDFSPSKRKDRPGKHRRIHGAFATSTGEPSLTW